MNPYTIKDLENLSGIKAHTIRIWEQRYSFLKPNRTNTNIRFYTGDELKKILNIALLNKYGYKISHIDKMGDLEIKEKILSLGNAQAQQERIIHELIQAMLDVDVDQFELVLDNYIQLRGIEKTITRIIFPYLEKIGILWLTNHINPAQEHLITNIIRQKLIVGIECIAPSVGIDKSVLLFLPEGEYHELGLLFIYYLLKKKGLKCIYTGCNTPMNDIEYLVKLKKPDYLYSHITTMNNSFNKFINNIYNITDRTPVIISGKLTHSYEKKIQPPVYFKKSFEEVIEFVASL